MQQAQYKRVLLKLSGEALVGDSQDSSIFNKVAVNEIVTQIKELQVLGVSLGIVIGGGNIFRGVNGAEFGLKEEHAHYMGMLATVMNGIALKDFLAHSGVEAQVFSALPLATMVKYYNQDEVLNALDNGKVIIFVAGTGNPFFTTDSGAALRAVNIGADLLIKATKVNGVYDKDPCLYSDAKKFVRISFDEAINKNLKVMDISAFELCRAHNINIQVCNVFLKHSLRDVVLSSSDSTLVYV
jgi:uridylate kinase